MGSPWETLGDDDDARLVRLEAVVRDFYDRILPDPMIGFLFQGKDVERLVRLETQFTARMLGRVGGAYDGRSMHAAHATSPILGGHFLRRQQILRETLADHGISPAATAAWLAHNALLADQVVTDRVGECRAPAEEEPPDAGKA